MSEVGTPFSVVANEARESVPEKPAKKQRGKSASPKAAADAALIEKLVGFLEGQRRLGGNAYPIKLGQLIELAGESPTHRGMIGVINSVDFRRRVVVPAKKTGADAVLRNEAPVVLKGDEQILARSFAIVEFAFQVACRTRKTRAYTVANLKKVLDGSIHDAFSAAINPRSNEYRLPPTCAVVRTEKSEVIFRIADMVTFGGSAPERAATPPDSVPGAAPNGATDNRAAPVVQTNNFSADFARVFGQLDAAQRNRNFVKLLDLRRALPQYDRKAFDEGLEQLRRERLFTLDSHEGNTVRLSDEEREAGIREGSSLLAYCSRKQ